MNLLRIFSLLLITLSSVLCRHIRGEDLEDSLQKELSQLPEIKEGRVQNSSNHLELLGINLTTPASDVLQENAADSVQVEPAEDALTNFQGNLDSPISKKRLQKMLKKAILQIITGDLTNADMRLLKDLNYDAEQVRRIREEEFRKIKEKQEAIDGEINSRNHMDFEHENSEIEDDLEGIPAESQQEGKNGYDYEAFNNRATFDYEYAASRFESTHGSWDDSLSEYDEHAINSTEKPAENGQSLNQNVVFKIRYNDSEFDSSSEENSRFPGEGNHQPALNGTGNNFPAVATSANTSPAPIDDQIETFSELYNFTSNYFSTTEETVQENNEVDIQTIPYKKQNEDLQVLVNITQLPEGHAHHENVQEPLNKEKKHSEVSPSIAPHSSATETPTVTNNVTSGQNRTKYKGLRWVGDNVYQVLPEYVDSLLNENIDNDTSDLSYDDAYQNLDDVVVKKSTTEDLDSVERMANDAPDSSRLSNSNANVSIENFVNLTGYHQAHRRTQKQKTVDEIKSRVLIITGRFNSSGNSNPLQPRSEKLTMFIPSCGIPRNTDTDLWQDPYSMNLHFQLNLTSDQQLVAAILRLYVLPQANSTATSSTMIDGVENDEKKIRLSIYYYTRSLKRHRSIRKRLIDSKVASLTTTGEHQPLDVKDAVRYWRSSSTRNTNHGLLVQVEDQEGRPLQPSHYVQTPDCQNHTDSNQQDEKAYQRVPALFIRACTRYVRLVGNKMIQTYEFCGQHPKRVFVREETNTY